jgi:hypothetical protein
MIHASVARLPVGRQVGNLSENEAISNSEKVDMLKKSINIVEIHVYADITRSAFGKQFFTSLQIVAVPQIMNFFQPVHLLFQIQRLRAIITEVNGAY